MPLCLSEAAANTRGRLCLRPSISGRCACTVPAPRQRHSRAMPTPCLHRAHAVLAPWPLGWGRPLAVAALTTPRPHCARTVWQRPSYKGRCRRHACAAPRPRYLRMLPQRHLTESATRADDATPAHCPHVLAEAAYLTAAAAGTPWPRHACAIPAQFRLCCCYCSGD